MSLKHLSSGSCALVPWYNYPRATHLMEDGVVFVVAIMYLHFAAFNVRWQVFVHSKMASISFSRLP